MVRVREFRKNKIPPALTFKPEAFPSTLDIEIGCGVGWHAIEYSRLNPDRYLIAIERTSNKFEKFARRKGNHKIENLDAIHANAINWVSTNLKAQQVDRYFILYPNPCPKDPQKRWFRMPFMKFLIETLKPGGTVTLATNIDAYYEEAKTYGAEVWGLKVIEDRIISKNEKPRTHFEKKYLAADHICHNLILQR